jgi:hypothetical protein
MKRKHVKDSPPVDAAKPVANARLTAAAWNYAHLARAEITVYAAFMITMFVLQFTWVYQASSEQRDQLPRFMPDYYDQVPAKCVYYNL